MNGSAIYAFPAFLRGQLDPRRATPSLTNPVETVSPPSVRIRMLHHLVTENRSQDSKMKRLGSRIQIRYDPLMLYNSLRAKHGLHLTDRRSTLSW